MIPERVGALGTKRFVQDGGVQTETVRGGEKVLTSKWDWLSKLLSWATRLRGQDSKC